MAKASQRKHTKTQQPEFVTDEEQRLLKIKEMRLPQHPRAVSTSGGIGEKCPACEAGHSCSVAVAPDPGLRGWANHDDSPSVRGDSVKAPGPFSGACRKNSALWPMAHVTRQGAAPRARGGASWGRKEKPRRARWGFSNAALTDGKGHTRTKQFAYVLWKGTEMTKPAAPKAPAHMIETINKIVHTSRQMLHEIGREPTPEELAEKLGMPVEKIRKVLKIAKEPILLETPNRR